MKSTHLQNTSEYKTFADELCENSNDIRKYKEIFGDQPVFTLVKPGEKAGFKGWNNPDKLLTPEKAEYVLNRNRNIGVALGLQTERGYTVGIDKESYGEVPNDVMGQIRECSAIEFDSQSGGNNHILTVTKESIKYLEQFKEKVYFSDNDKHDLEILTSGHCIVPPSRIDEDHQYDSLKVDPQAPTVDIDSIKEILGPIPISKKSEGETSNTTNNRQEGSESYAAYEKLPSDFDIESHFKDNVAYFAGNFDDDKSHFKQFLHEVLEQDRISKRVFTNPDDKSQNEKLLAIDLGWYLQNDTKSIQYFFEQVLPGYRNNELKFNNNKYHRNDCLDLDSRVSRPYWVQGLSFSFRHQLAQRFLQHETLTSNQLYEDKIFNERSELQSYSERQIDRGLEVFTEFGLIKEIDDNTYKNKSINEEYVQELGNICEKDEYRPIKYPNEDGSL